MSIWSTPSRQFGDVWTCGPTSDSTFSTRCCKSPSAGRICHLHRFAIGGSPFDENSELFLCPYDVEEGEDDGTPTKDATLDETLSTPGDVLRYCYDYGDSWDLRIALESVRPVEESAPVAVCIDGRRAAPPEDSGGLRDAADLAPILEDPAHFDIAEINRQLDDQPLTDG